MSGSLAIVAALRAELAPLVRACHEATTIRQGGHRWVRARLAGQPVVLAATGDGARAARSGIEALLDHERPARLLILGVSGGLSPELTVGDQVVGDRVLPGEPGGNAVPDAVWNAQLAGLPGVRRGSIVAVESIALDPMAKARVWNEHGKPVAAVVDLESAVFAGAAGRRGVPFTILRAVLDDARETLPLDFNRCLDREGRVSSAKVVVRLAVQPGAVGGLWDLRRRLAECARSLAATTVAVVARQSEMDCREAGREKARA